MPKSGLVTEGETLSRQKLPLNIMSLQARLADLHLIVGRPMKNVQHDSNKLNSEIFCF